MQKSFEERFLASRTTQFTETFWNGMIREVGLRLRTLESIKVSFDELTQLGIEVVLARLNEVLLPAAQKIRDLSTLGFLIAKSETSVTLADGPAQFVIVPGTQRELFTPSEFVAITRESTTADYAIAHVLQYDAETGVLEVDVKEVFGDPGPHADWEIGALAGSTMASVAMLAEVRAKYAAVLAAAAAAVPAADTATAKAAIATEAATAAIAAAAAAATFNPSSYYTKSATYSKTEVDNKVTAEASARSTAVTDEATARANADTTLSNDLTTAINARVSKLPLQTKNANFNAAAGNAYLITAGVICNFPAAPVAGNRIGIITESAIKDTPCTINLNGATFDGLTTNVVIAVPTSLIFEFYGGAWRLA